MKAVFVASAMLAALLFTAQGAEALRHHGGVANGAAPGTCVYGVDNGCAAANQNGSFKDATLLTSAQQSGQNSLLPTHPMTFNIPGVDYPLGPDKTLTPQDPRNITLGNSGGVCSWNGTYVDCTQGSGVVNVVLNNYDWSGTKIGKACVVPYFANNGISAGSTFTVTNSYFCMPPNNGDSPFAMSGNASFTFKNNQFDGLSNTTNLTGVFFDSGSTAAVSLDVEYNAFLNVGGGRIANGLTNVNFILKYNYITGINTLNTTNHGELMLRNCSGARANCTALDDYEGNFIVWTCCVAFTGGNGDNATIFPGDGASDGVTLSSMTFSTNIVVVNTTASGGLQPDQALLNARLASMGVVNISNNWIDASGSNGCSVSGAKSGGNTVTAQSSGNTLTVTGLSASFGNNPIEPGWIIAHAGFTQTPITAYGTGVGNTGTYTFGGATQAVGSDSLWTLVPGFTSATLTGNFNLNDPSHTGVPQAMNLSGLQFAAGTCVN